MNPDWERDEASAELGDGFATTGGGACAGGAGGFSPNSATTQEDKVFLDQLELGTDSDWDEKLRLEREQSCNRLKVHFQTAATAIAQLYTERFTQAEISLWIPFQNAAASTTNLYKESLDVQKKSIDVGIQCGYQRRAGELVNWVRKQRRRHIRRDDLLAFLSGRSNLPRTRSSGAGVRERGASPRLPPPDTGLSSFDCDSMQPFRDALALQGLNGAMAGISVRSQSSSPQSSSQGHSAGVRRRSSPDHVASLFNDEIIRGNSDSSSSRKRSSPPIDVQMDSPTHKRARWQW